MICVKLDVMNTVIPHTLETRAVIAVSVNPVHGFTKVNKSTIRLLKGLGVEGDAHMGDTVKHRSRVAQNPSQPNLRQVHLIHAELFDELRPSGFDIKPGDIGENILTRGVDLLGLPTGARLRIGAQTVVEITGLRNPCAQLNRFMPGLAKVMIDAGPNGEMLRKAGVMGVVLEGGEVRPGDAIKVALPPPPHRPLERV